MLHLMKLCVGVRDPAQLRALQSGRTELRHLTRHMPRRAGEIVPAGSLYWVIGGAMLVRQRVSGIVPACRPDGTACAAILLDRELVPVDGRPVKAFQGWRYLRADDAPEDLTASSPGATLPPALAQELRALGLL